MAFIKRKGVKFSAELQVCCLSDVPLVNAVVFAKIRLLDGGSFEDTTERIEIVNHGASWKTVSRFLCRIVCDPVSGILEKCMCRISIRKEQKGGKSFYKLGYVDVNLSEFAGSGVEGMSRSYLLNGYTMTQRLDNTKVSIRVTMSHHTSDPIFRVPRPLTSLETEEGNLNPKANRASDAVEPVEDVTVTLRNSAMTEPAETSSMTSSLVVEDIVSEKKHSVLPAPTVNTPLRRFSQDRSTHRIQQTRFDAGCVVDEILAASRLSDISLPEQQPNMSLFIDRDGKLTESRCPTDDQED